MLHNAKNIKIFSANSNPNLAASIANHLNLPLASNKVGKFSDGEIFVNLDETVRGSDVFIIQSTCDPVNDHLMELLVMIDACKRASAGRIVAVMPYFGYARQDRKAKARDPITAKLVANLITAAGATRVLTMDLHAAQIQGFFDIPVDHLLGVPLLAPYYLEKFDSMEDVVVVSPDFGSVTRARNFSRIIDTPVAIIDKRRPRPNVSEVMNIIGDIKDKKVILVDDMIDTAGTITHGAEALLEKGAKEVYACCTHPVLSGPAMERIAASPIKELVVLDTIELPEEKKAPNIKVLSVAKLFADAIEKIYEDESISPLFAPQIK